MKSVHRSRGGVLGAASAYLTFLAIAAFPLQTYALLAGDILRASQQDFSWQTGTCRCEQCQTAPRTAASEGTAEKCAYIGTEGGQCKLPPEVLQEGSVQQEVEPSLFCSCYCQPVLAGTGEPCDLQSEEVLKQVRIASDGTCDDPNLPPQASGQSPELAVANGQIAKLSAAASPQAKARAAAVLKWTSEAMRQQAQVDLAKENMRLLKKWKIKRIR
mmetsp:Transcript_18599/g.33607  ORF Transcript_18599/g.33607 Transcript_18599/m.33607 type:complete len:216 (+) Transcript_18599:100-747(+)